MKMRQADFIQEYKISNARPTKLANARISVIQFASTVREFLTVNFGASVCVDCDAVMKNPGYITICPEYVAYFLKLVMISLHGDDVLYIGMECDQDDKFVMRVESKGFARLEIKEVSEIIRAAANTQFAIYESSRGIVLKKSLKFSPVLAMHASSDNIMRVELERMFFAGYDDENNLGFFKDLKRK